MKRIFRSGLVAFLFCSFLQGTTVTTAFYRSSIAQGTELAESKARLQLTVTTLSSFVERASRIAGVTFDNEQQRQEAISAIRDAVRSLVFLQRQIQTNNLAFDEEVLSQLNGLASVMLDILSALDSSTPELPKAAQRTIALVAKDLQHKMLSVNEIRGLPAADQISRYPHFPVTVRTLGRDGREAFQLTIYYVPQALYGTPQERVHTRSFRQLSSPSKQDLPEADYFLWAGTGQKAASEVKDLSVRKPSAGTENIIDLLVLQ